MRVKQNGTRKIAETDDLLPKPSFTPLWVDRSPLIAIYLNREVEFSLLFTLTIEISSERFVKTVSQLAQEYSLVPPGCSRKILPILSWISSRKNELAVPGQTLLSQNTCREPSVFPRNWAFCCDLQARDPIRARWLVCRDKWPHSIYVLSISGGSRKGSAMSEVQAQWHWYFKEVCILYHRTLNKAGETFLPNPLLSLHSLRTAVKPIQLFRYQKWIV